MPYCVVTLPSFTITSGTTESNTLQNLGYAYGMIVQGSATLTSTSLVVKIELTDTGTNFATLQSGGIDVEILAGKATVMAPVVWKQMKLVASTTELQTDTLRVAQIIHV